MHVLQLANFYTSTSGGLRTAVDRLAAEYIARGNRCTLIIPDADDSIESENGRCVVRMRSPRLPLTGGYRAIVDRSAVRAAIDAFDPDVIELSDKVTLPSCARWARERGVPTVLITHERLDAVIDSAIWNGGLAGATCRRLARRLAADVDAIVAASNFAAAEFDAIGAYVDRIPLGVDLDRFHPQPGRPRSDPARLICVVRLSVEKQPWIVVETSRALRQRGIDHTLTVYGDGPLRARLTASAAGLPVEFRGHTNDREELAAAMAAADAAVAPGPLETFGLAALELMASGTPVVVPAGGSLAELVVDGAGVVAERAPNAFATAVEQLVRGDRESQRHAARQRAEQFTWNRTAERMLDVFDRVSSKSVARSR